MTKFDRDVYKLPDEHFPILEIQWNCIKLHATSKLEDNRDITFTRVGSGTAVTEVVVYKNGFQSKPDHIDSIVIPKKRILNLKRVEEFIIWSFNIGNSISGFYAKQIFRIPENNLGLLAVMCDNDCELAFVHERGYVVLITTMIPSTEFYRIIRNKGRAADFLWVEVTDRI